MPLIDITNAFGRPGGKHDGAAKVDSKADGRPSFSKQTIESKVGVGKGGRGRAGEASVSDTMNYLLDTICASKHIIECKFAIEIIDNDPLIAARRAFIIDWLVDAHSTMKLENETLHLVVSIYDRYLSVEKVDQRSYKLVAVSSLLIAAKYEEVYFPELEEFAALVDHNHSIATILKTEMKILLKLRFEITSTTSLYFYNLLFHIFRDEYGDEGEGDAPSANIKRFSGLYFLEIAMTDPLMQVYLPSLIAASALILAHQLTSSGRGKIAADDCRAKLHSVLGSFTPYSEEELRLCADDLSNVVFSYPTSLTASFTKYSLPAYLSVALLLRTASSV